MHKAIFEYRLGDRPHTVGDSGMRDLLSDITRYDPDPRARQTAQRALAYFSPGTPTQRSVPAPSTFATLVSLEHNTSMPLALYVSPGGVFRVVPFMQGEAIVAGISERAGRLNLAVELP